MENKKALGLVGIIVVIVVLLIFASLLIGWMKTTIPATAKKVGTFLPGTPGFVEEEEELYYKGEVGAVIDENYRLWVRFKDPNGKYVSAFSPYTGFKAWEDKTQTVVRDIKIVPSMYTIFLLDASSHTTSEELAAAKQIISQVESYTAERERGAVFYLSAGKVNEAEFVKPSELAGQLSAILPGGNALYWDGIYKSLNATNQVRIMEIEIGQEFMKNIFVISHGVADGTELQKVDASGNIVPMNTPDEAKAEVLEAFDAATDIRIFFIDFANCGADATKAFTLNSEWNKPESDRVFCYSATKDGLAEGELGKIANDMFKDFNTINLSWRPIAEKGSGKHNITVQVTADSNKGKAVLPDYIY